MRVFVTGSKGFIGTHLMNRLVYEGHDAIGYDLKDGNDILDKNRLSVLMKGAEYVVHLAAEKSVPKSWEDPAVFFKTNILGTLEVFKAALDCKVKRVIVASSSSAHQTLSPYSVSKKGSEMVAKMFWDVHNVESICLRFFNVFGPGQPLNGAYSAVVPKFIDAIKRGEPPCIYGSGNQYRDFTYVDNVVEAVILAIRSETLPFGAYVDIGTGNPHTVLDLLSEISDAMGKPMPVPNLLPDRLGDIQYSEANIDMARSAFGYTPVVGFEEGINRTVNDRD